MSFSVRAEFFNLFNMMESLGNPSTGSPQNPADAVRRRTAHGRFRIPQLHGDRGQQREFLVAYSPHGSGGGAHPVLGT